MDWPKDFVLGVATSTAQIEGGAKADGRTPSICEKVALGSQPGGHGHSGLLCLSLMDNMEWVAGPYMKYGLIQTNFRNFETTWKKSACFYRDYIARAKGKEPCNLG